VAGNLLGDRLAEPLAYMLSEEKQRGCPMRERIPHRTADRASALSWQPATSAGARTDRHLSSIQSRSDRQLHVLVDRRQKRVTVPLEDVGQLAQNLFHTCCFSFSRPGVARWARRCGRTTAGNAHATTPCRHAQRDGCRALVHPTAKYAIVYRSVA